MCSSRAACAHSNQLREFLLTNKGINLLDVYVGPEGVLTGSARASLEARERSAALALQEESDSRRRDRDRRRAALEAKITALRKEFEIEDSELSLRTSQDVNHGTRLVQDRQTMATLRQADDPLVPSRSVKRR